MGEDKMIKKLLKGIGKRLVIIAVVPFLSLANYGIAIWRGKIK